MKDRKKKKVGAGFGIFLAFLFPYYSIYCSENSKLSVPLFHSVVQDLPIYAQYRPQVQMHAENPQYGNIARFNGYSFPDFACCLHKMNQYSAQMHVLFASWKLLTQVLFGNTWKAVILLNIITVISKIYARYVF